MDDLALLETIIEFSIGLGGFSAIVAVFLHRDEGMAPVDRARVLNLLAMSLLPALVAFFALGLSLLIEDLNQVAQWSSMLFCIALVGMMIAAIRGRLAVEPNVRRRLMPTHVFVPMSTVASINAIGQLYCSLGLAGAYSFVILYFGLVLSLAQGVVQFIRIILARPAAERGDGQPTL